MDNNHGLIPDPKAHASTVADMMQRAAELNEGKEIANIKMHREQFAVIVAALRAYAMRAGPNRSAKDFARELQSCIKALDGAVWYDQEIDPDMKHPHPAITPFIRAFADEKTAMTNDGARIATTEPKS